MMPLALQVIQLSAESRREWPRHDPGPPPAASAAAADRDRDQ
jgi:hypothetical protein